jgi:hypothetical protein
MAFQTRPEIPGGFRFYFDGVNKILLLRLEGGVTEEILREIYIVGRKYWTATKPKMAIVDCSAVTGTAISSDRILELAKPEPMPDTVGRPRIIVAPTTLQYRLARVFQIVSSREGPVAVVHTMDEALAELGIESPPFEPLQ